MHPHINGGNMDTQISQIIWTSYETAEQDEKTAPAEQLVLKNRDDGRSVIEVTHGGSTRNFPVPAETCDALREDIEKLLAANPDCEPVQPPRRAEVRYADGRTVPLPWGELKSLLENTAEEAKFLLYQAAPPQLMGAVANFTGNQPKFTGFMGIMGMQTPAPAPSPVRIDNGTWNCGCGAKALHGKFCPECGSAAPPPLPEPWNCPQCGAKALTSRFCPECGSQRPEQA